MPVASVTQSTGQAAVRPRPFCLRTQLFPAHSEFDVGCGTGIWAAVLQELGVSDVLGWMGNYVPPDQRHSEPEHFLEHDSASGLHSQPNFDLCLGLEVAEHLPRHVLTDAWRIQ